MAYFRRKSQIYDGWFSILPHLCVAFLVVYMHDLCLTGSETVRFSLESVCENSF